MDLLYATEKLRGNWCNGFWPYTSKPCGLFNRNDTLPVSLTAAKNKLR